MRGARSALTALAIAATSLTACSGASETGATASATASGAATTGATVTTPAHGEHKTIVIKTQFVDFDGTVVAGSLIGDSSFCPGGTLHHEFGSPEIGYPAINVFTCGESQLKIGFGPGPDQMNNRIQTSDWEILGGSGDFVGVTGSGQMKVEFPRVGASRGQETFTGTVVVP
jgi:hypothetical protein